MFSFDAELVLEEIGIDEGDVGNSVVDEIDLILRDVVDFL